MDYSRPTYINRQRIILSAKKGFSCRGPHNLMANRGPHNYHDITTHDCFNNDTT